MEVESPAVVRRKSHLMHPLFMEWHIGLSAWIIQDGNYPDFAVGDRFEAALEFGFYHPPAMVERGVPSAKHVEGCDYEVVARIETVAPDLWVVDIGIKAFQESPPPVGALPGQMASGQIYLGIDPFFYFESLGQLPQLPPLIYTWRVLDIVRQTAPLIPAGERMLVRDPERRGWQPLERTEAWKDDGGNGEYVLRCELLPDPPQRSRTQKGWEP